MDARDSFDRLLDDDPLVALGSDEDDEPTLRFHYEEAVEEDATLETVYRGQIGTTSGVPLCELVSQQRRPSALEEFFRARPKRDLGIQLVARTTRSDRPLECDPEDTGEASDDRAA